MFKYICQIILFLFGWSYQVVNEDTNKFSKTQAIYTVAPHTSYFDGFWGMLILRQLKIKYVSISADWLFYWPLKYIMVYMLHAIPASKSKKIISYLKSHEESNLIICPEGQLKPTNIWPNGYYRIAKLLKKPIIPVAINYYAKIVTIGEPIFDLSDEENIKAQLNLFYQQFGYAKYPSKFMYNKIKED